MFTHHIAIREMRPYRIRLMQTHQPWHGIGSEAEPPSF